MSTIKYYLYKLSAIKKIKLKDKRVLVFLFVLALLGILYLYKTFMPVFTYDINLAPNQEAPESPLVIAPIGQDSVFYDFSIKSQEDSINQIELKVNRQFIKQPPFIDYGSSITLLVTIKEKRQDPEKVPEEELIPSKLYEISGTVNNLKQRDYKIRVEDQFGNLIDEKNFSLKKEKISEAPKLTNENTNNETENNGEVGNGENVSGNSPSQEPISKESTQPASINPMKACKIKEDCVPVGCGCNYSGCGGLSYDDVINKKYDEVWYYEHDCKPIAVCSKNRCEKVEIGCENSVCTVKKL